jgi:antitoxin component YwqK of YwqJK toxin-antitoxin module
MDTGFRKTFTLIFIYSLGFASFSQNITDERGLKQGFWKVTGIDSSIYERVEIIEGQSRVDTVATQFVKLEGSYKDGKRVGVWISRYGVDHLGREMPMSEFTFIDGELEGPIIVYYGDGKVKYRGSIERRVEKVTLEARSVRSTFYGKHEFDLEEIIKEWSHLDQL